MLSATWVSGLSSLAGDTTASQRRTVPAASHGSASSPYALDVPAAPIDSPAPPAGSAASSGALAIRPAADRPSTASARSIPEPALIAYQRAAQVIDATDTSCHLGWELLAALGAVESDHGRFGRNVLSPDGVSIPGVFGPRLDGSGHASVVPDTDAGQLDGDPSFDRAIGPMQFLPATWTAVKVDGDGDGLRNPQDVDDAALAAAIYLCSGSGDLATTSGQRDAVFRYNHSARYVQVVLGLASAYAAGGYAAVPAAFTTGAVLVPAASPARARSRHAKHHAPTKPAHGSSMNPAPGSAQPTASTPPRNPATPATHGLTATVRDLADGGIRPAGAIAQVLTAAQAQVRCLKQGLAAVDLAGLATCVAQLVGGSGR
jgi:membrane-bound lytic murein transglycosylase B